jgi:hypothetical protein
VTIALAQSSIHLQITITQGGGAAAAAVTYLSDPIRAVNCFIKTSGDDQ